MTESHIAEILETLSKSINKPGREPDVFTTAEFQAQSKWSKDRALNALKSMATEGRVTPSMIRVTNAWGIEQTVKGWRVNKKVRKR